MAAVASASCAHWLNATAAGHDRSHSLPSPRPDVAQASATPSPNAIANASSRAMQINEQWLTLEHWLSQNLPEVLADLNPGCSSQDLDELAHHLGCSLPEDFRAFYQRHNGQKGNTTGIFCGLPYLSLEALYSEWSGWQELWVEFAREAEMYGEESLAFEITGQSYPIHAIKPTYINLKWIPIAHDGGGNHLGIDLDPGAAGTIGQVINFGRDEKDKFVLATSLANWMAWMMTQYQQGNYQRSQRSLALQEPANSHFLDGVPQLFGARGTP